jgi:3-oxoadipate enol-lactonase
LGAADAVLFASAPLRHLFVSRLHAVRYPQRASAIWPGPRSRRHPRRAQRVKDRQGARRGPVDGGFATAHFARRYPDRTLSACICGCGYGSEKHLSHQFQAEAKANAERIRTEGQSSFAEGYAHRAGRLRLREKDPRGFAEFLEQLKQHDTTGAALTMQEYQGKRPSLYDFEAAWAACTVPSLIIVGDEDDNALQPSVWLKRTMANAGLLVVPKTGHTVNLEDPEFFNRVVWDFVAQVEAGKWTPRQTVTAR